jgi:hypothetical protein
VKLQGFLREMGLEGILFVGQGRKFKSHE